MSKQTLSLSCVNWRDAFPYQPQASVEVTTDDSGVSVLFSVCGKEILAASTADHSNVWCDSCVEFFCREPQSDHYINFEMNCVGAMTAARRRGRSDDVKHLSLDELSEIKRYAPLSMESIIPFHVHSEHRWQAGMTVPFHIIYGMTLDEWRAAGAPVPETLLCNFYICADKADEPYFVSWAPINTSAPDFHRPEFFKPLPL